MFAYLFLLFGLLAIISTMLNLIFTLMKKEAKWFRYLGIAFTALTLCAFYQMDATYVVKQDWSALMDITPTISGVLWFLTAASILLNSISLFKKDTH